ncbi:MAG: hypothetical protein E7Z84_09205 [Methanosphaera stadtmanae]|nr:hypothetical protein [Methanosphaera stadtmanae]
MNRLGLFLCFDSDGIIDEYVTYLLDDIIQNLSDLCIIVNGDLSPESREILEQYSTDIMTRPNIGFDAGGWRDAMIEHIGFKKLQEYDEVILFNDSFFGPLYPFKEMFDVMDAKNIDFWGITVHGDAPNARDLCPYGYRPRYLQTYFLAFRKNLIKSKEFQKYWSELPNYQDFNNLAFKHEGVFTRYFSDLGFKWEAYVDTADIEGPIEKAMSFHTFNMYDMVVNRRLPVIKRKAFKLPRKLHLRYNAGKYISSTMEYIDNHTSYDVSLIYKYFLRTMDHDTFSNTLNSVSIIPKDNTITRCSDKKIVVIAHLYYDDLWEYAYNYLKNVPEYMDIIITTDTEDKKEFFEEHILKPLKNKSQVIVVNARGRDMSGLLVGCKDIIKDYDYFCFMHDKKSEAKEYVTVGASFRDILWDNMLSSPNYIESIVNQFDENPNLGLIVPPKIYHGTYFFSYVNKYWTLCFEEAQDLLERMNINVAISKENPPISIGNCYWAKYDALKPLFDLDLDYEDFPEEPMPNDGTISHALERIYGYVAASQNYYSKIVMTEEFGRVELFNYEYMMSSVLSVSKKSRNNQIVFNRSFEGFINTLPRALNASNPAKLKKLQKENKKLKQSLKENQDKVESLENELEKLKNSTSIFSRISSKFK